MISFSILAKTSIVCISQKSQLFQVFKILGGVLPVEQALDGMASISKLEAELRCSSSVALAVEKSFLISCR
jgi:hypothetical protein